jgi:hypothetical protein
MNLLCPKCILLQSLINARRQGADDQLSATTMAKPEVDRAGVSDRGRDGKATRNFGIAG